MYNYWKGLIHLRKSDLGKIFRIAEEPPANYYEWFEPENTKLLGYMVSKKILVIINTDTISGTFEDVNLPESSSWRLIANIDEVNLKDGIRQDPYSKLQGSKGYTLTLPAESLKIWVRQ